MVCRVERVPRGLGRIRLVAFLWSFALFLLLTSCKQEEPASKESLPEPGAAAQKEAAAPPTEEPTKAESAEAAKAEAPKPDPAKDAVGLDPARVTTSASSVLAEDPPGPRERGDATALVDGSLATAWVEGAEGDGVGEWVEIVLPVPCKVWRLDVANGRQGEPGPEGDPFALGGRVQDVQVDLGDGNPFLATLEDKKDVQQVVVGGKPAERIRLRIRSVYAGSKHETALSEVSVFVSKEDAEKVAAMPAPTPPPVPVEPPPPAEPEVAKPEPVQGIDRKAMTMADIPGGGYLMGVPMDWAQEFMDLCLDGSVESTCSTDMFSDLAPVHEVRISSFYMDQYEVTNANYQQCVWAGACAAPKYFDVSELNASNQPVSGVNWFDAYSFCTWAGRRLPTEAEWEYAARRGQGARYPWGMQPPDGILATFCDADCIAYEYAANRTGQPRKGPDAVNAHAEGRTADGLYNMSGNVAEWTGDAYGQGTYKKHARSRAVSDPFEPGRSNTVSRTVKGGGWGDSPIFLDTRFRRSKGWDSREKSLGFRCASSSGGSGMARIPGGSFTRGVPEEEVAMLLTECQQDQVLKKCSFDVRFKDQTPQYTVNVSPYKIDKFPVTVGMYRQCVQQGLCKENGSIDTPGFNGEDLPITMVSWDGAKKYCESQSKRLCTEAEWEVAARGKSPDGFFPWGTKDITPAHAVFCYGDCAAVPTKEREKDPRFRSEAVLSRKLNISGFGVYDMSGNICEWTSDKYVSNAYGKCAKKGCTDPKYPVKKKKEDVLVRGGSFNQGPTKVTATYRAYRGRTLQSTALGFRCCQSPVPTTP